MAESALARLTEINVDDMLSAWGLDRARIGRRLLRAAARPFAMDFARDLLQYDDAVGEGGLRAGGAMLCRRHTGGVRASGVEHVPLEGPVLVLANHPGLCDTVALFAAIPRSDLRVIALDRPFLRALPSTRRSLFLLPDDVSSRAGATRAVARFLRDGGTALTFPAGHIEPDPLVLPGAEAALNDWSQSIGLFVRLVPGAQIVVAVVGGVYTPTVLANPITRLRREKQDRELLAAALQLMWRPYQRNVVSIVFAPPLHAADLLARHTDPVKITQAITDTARKVLADWPTDWEIVVPDSGERLQMAPGAGEGETLT